MMRLLVAGLVFGSVMSMAGAAAAQVPDYYVGVGVRAFFNDDTSVILDSKAKIVDLGSRNDYSASLRPAVYFGDETAFRVPVTFEAEATENFYPFVGGGVAYNTDGDENLDPMITAGLDVRLSDQLILNLEGNFIFQPSDTDAELAASINFEF
ncbi:MAG: hypothetical protein AAFY78_20820 [Cyanobacteria bacterium J06648_16]